jgi:hypothetical protein
VKRIIIHWTAGSHKASALDRKHYHFIIEGDGTIVMGNHKPEANASITKPNDSSTYAAHTRGTNTGAIGIAVAAMAGAQERPFNAGRFPITPRQVEALVAHCQRIARVYGIPITRQTVLTHAEVQPTLGIKQAGKWDITWLPGMAGPDDPVKVGDKLRALIAAKPVVEAVPPRPDMAQDVVANETSKTNTKPGSVSQAGDKPAGGLAYIVGVVVALAAATFAGAWEWIAAFFGG